MYVLSNLRFYGAAIGTSDHLPARINGLGNLVMKKYIGSRLPEYYKIYGGFLQDVYIGEALDEFRQKENWHPDIQLSHFNRQMKIAHLILTHKNPKQLERLLNALQHDAFDFFIHVDRKTDIEPFKFLESRKQVPTSSGKEPIFTGPISEPSRPPSTDLRKFFPGVMTISM